MRLGLLVMPLPLPMPLPMPMHALGRIHTPDPEVHAASTRPGERGLGITKQPDGVPVPRVRYDAMHHGCLFWLGMIDVRTQVMDAACAWLNENL